jgi:hypothetical protein
MIESIRIDAVSLDNALEIPKLLKRRTLRGDNDDNNDLVCNQEAHGKLAQTLEGFSYSYDM